jgi:hypothetical protein
MSNSHITMRITEEISMPSMNSIAPMESTPQMQQMSVIKAASHITEPAIINSPITIIEQRTDKYNPIEENNFLNTLINPTSTFRTTCNTASMGIVKSNILGGKTINKSMIRIEELMNYFDYRTYFQTIIDNQELILSNYENILSILSGIAFILGFFIMYFLIRNMIKNR